MNKQSITFKADEQELIKTGGIEHYASNIVAYIEATFELGENWTGYDSIRAVWSNDYLTDISTVLDPNGKCIVPTEVLTDTGNVTVNLVGSIADGDTLTDRLTTYPCKAVIVDADAKVEGDETESITPSQFEQFVEIVHDEVEQVTGMTAEAETLPAGSDATASYSGGVLSFGIPRGDKGEQGEQGETGHTGEPAGFGDVTASVDNTVGTPSVNVTASGPDTAKEFDFEFHNLKGDKGDTGDTGATGNGIASTALNPDYTLTITFTDGTSYTTPSIRGAKGDTGDTGATGNGIQSTVLNADYTLTITFTDGTSYTTPSIRGEQGPAGPVSDVQVNGTSVVDPNGVAKILMPELIKTASGNPIVLDDAFGEVKKLDVELLPIQDLHGYSKPWAAGAGKNKFLTDFESPQTVNGITFTKNSDGTVTANGAMASPTDFVVGHIALKAGSYILNGCPSGGGSSTYRVQVTDYPVVNNLGLDSGSGASFTINSDMEVAIRIQIRASVSNVLFKPMIRLATESDATFVPYSNICPITGHDSVTVTDTGINQWDEEWELGVYDSQTSVVEKYATTTHIRSKNYIPATPNTTYYFNSAGKNVHLIVADANDNVLYRSTTLNNGTFVTPSNGTRIYFNMAMAYGNTYNNDISINLPSTDTAYHAYHGQSKTVTLPHTVYGGKPNITTGNGTETVAYLKLNTADMNLSEAYPGWQNSGVRAIIGAGKNTFISDALTNVSPKGVNAIGANTVATNDQLIMLNGYFGKTQTEWKALAMDVEFIIPLETPLDLSTTPTDITLYNGDNVISSNGDMELTYVQDMAIVIEKLENLL